MVHTFFQTGLRAGELGGLYTEDVLRVNEGFFIRVLMRPDNKMDIRTRQPQVKTGPRAIPIDDRLWMLLDHYIMSIRPLTPHALTHPYLFVSSRTGEPLGRDGINGAFSALGIVLEQPIHPHIARHTFTTNLKRNMQKKGISDEKIDEKLMSANGWTDKRSPKRYTQRDIDESRMQLTREYQASIFKR
jgi:integrase